MELPHALHTATPAELVERNAAERRGRPYLLYRDGDGAQRIHDLDEASERLTIGRSANNDVALTWDSEVSRIHAHLERFGDEWTFVDDGFSRNGSFIDGERIRGRARLRHGDTIGLGRTRLVFCCPSGSESLRTATSRERVVPAITPGQKRVLVALCRPYADKTYGIPASNRQIADELVLGVETIKTHMKALFDAFELGAVPGDRKRTALAQLALQSGLVGPRDFE